MNALSLAGLSVAPHAPVLWILGPCVIESDSQARRLAEGIASVMEPRGLRWVFKASFDKANRTSLTSFRGPGLESGLRTLERIGVERGVPVTTDVHLPSQVPAVADVVQLLQVPAFLCRQTDLLVACGQTGVPVNLKRGQFLAPQDLVHAAAKVGGPCMGTERGTTLGYRDLVADLRSVDILHDAGLPACFDATHSVQQPGGAGGHSSGQRRHVPTLTRAAVAAGYDALFLEVHASPSDALSDAATQWPLDGLADLVDEAMRIADAVGRPR